MNGYHVTSGPILTESQLRDIGKDLKRLLTGSGTITDSPTEEISKTQLFRNVRKTALSEGLRSSHRVAAYNVLCGMIEIGVLLEDPETRSLFSNEENAHVLLDIYLRQAESGKRSSMNQVLGALIVLIKADINHVSPISLRKTIITELCDVFFRQNIQIKAKSAIYALTTLLSKNIIDLDFLLDSFNSSFEPEPKKTSLDCLSSLLKETLKWLTLPETVAPASSLVALIIRKAKEGTQSSQEGCAPFWVGPMIEILQHNPSILFGLRNHLFVDLFQNDIQEFWAVLNTLQAEDLLRSCSKVIQGDEGRSDYSAQYSLILCLLLIGKEVDIVELKSSLECDRAIQLDGNRVILAEPIVSRELFSSDNSELRISALALTITSRQLGRPLTLRHLQILQKHFPLLLHDTEPRFRSQVLSHVQMLLDRWRACTSALHRELASKRVPSYLTNRNLQGLRPNTETNWQSCEAGQLLLQHFAFLEWLFDHICHGLHASASYERHSMALGMMNLFLQSGLDPHVPSSALAKRAKSSTNWRIQLNLAQPRVLRLLLDLLFDPFDDVRQQSASIICTLQCQYAEWSSLIELFITRGKVKMMNSSRLDHADGVARGYEIILNRSLLPNLGVDTATSQSFRFEGTDLRTSFQIVAMIMSELEKAIEVAENNIQQAVRAHPIHGHFTALRYCLTATLKLSGDPQRAEIVTTFVRPIMTAMKTFWHCVWDVLCNDAPEGFTLDRTETASEIHTGDLLSYSWRGIKESSLLLGDMTSNIQNTTRQRPDEERLFLESAGELSFSQLAELRHRGAFSTVAQTFSVVCQACARCKQLAVVEKLDTWYNRLLHLIHGPGSTFTRRSAGIPSILIGILTAHPDGRMFRPVLDDLQRIALLAASRSDNDNVDIPQVHAMNCLRAVFTSTRLSHDSEKYIVRVMEIASAAFGSQVWAIRNCGLMLFRSLIDRLSGADKTLSEDDVLTPSNIRVSYDNYPGLSALLLDTLRDAVSRQEVQNQKGYAASVALEAAFPILEIFSRAPPSIKVWQHLESYIMWATAGAHWHLRKLAAKTYVRGIEIRNRLVSSFASLLTSDGPVLDHNRLHGRLCCAFEIVKLVRGSNDYDLEVPRLLQTVQETCAFWMTISSFVVKSTFIAIVNEIGWMSVRLCSEEKSIKQPIDLRSMFGALHSLIRSNWRAGNFAPATTQFHPEPQLDQINIKASVNVDTIPLLVHQYFVNLIFNLLVQTNGLEYIELAESELLLSKPVLDGMIDTRINNNILARVLGECHLQIQRMPLRCRDNFTQTLIHLLAVSYRQVNAWSHISPKSYVLTEALLTNLECVGSIPSATASIINFVVSDASLLKQYKFSSSPLELQQSIRFHGFKLGMQILEGKTIKIGFLEDFMLWKSRIRASIHENNDLVTRSAAVRSLKNFVAGLQRCHCTLPNAIILEIALTLYDVLNDDDDELRALGSTAVSMLLSIIGPSSKQPSRFSPRMAAKKLLSYLKTQHVRSPRVMQVAIKRLTGKKITDLSQSSCFEYQLEAAIAESGDLFVIEKQNLYIDLVREAAVWSDVLEHLLIDMHHIRSLEVLIEWCISGLAALTEKASQNVDGPLGWTSKPEVFALGMSLFWASRAVIFLNNKNRKGSLQKQRIREALARLVAVGKENSLHELWVEEITQILKDSIYGGLQRHWRRVHTALRLVTEIER